MSTVEPSPTDAARSPLDRARRKAYLRLLPILFVCYVVAYVDRTNVGLAKLNMMADLPSFTETAIGLGGGLFFVGYLLLEIPGTLLVERWSASKWICRIMVSWGFVAALTAFVTVPWQFYVARFLLGLAEAGFFPGVIVYLTHWFPARDRARALSWFLVATPIAQFISPLVSEFLLPIGTDERVGGVIAHYPMLLGLKGWQWVFIGWGLPAVLMGFVVLVFLTDRPGQARWLSTEEREALEAELAREKAERRAKGGHMTFREALANPKVIALTLAYFLVVTGNYGFELFLPSILTDWYHPSRTLRTLVLMIPPIGSLVGQLFVGWNSDRTKERRLHAGLPILLGGVAFGLTMIRGMPLGLTIALFTVTALGLKAYLPAFWTLPTLFLTEAAAAGSIGLINSFGNLGGFLGPSLLGFIKDRTGSYLPAMAYLCASIIAAATIILRLGLGRAEAPKGGEDQHPLADPAHDLDLDLPAPEPARP